MAEVLKIFFRRLFPLVGLAIVLLCSLALWRVYYVLELKKIEIDIANSFNEFIIHKGEFYLPAVRVAELKNDNVVNLIGHGEDYLLLNIWATWCGSCVRELPELRDLSRALSYGGGWNVAAVSIDANLDRGKVSQFVERYNVGDVAKYYDNNLELQKTVNVKKLPMTLILNDSGRVLYEIYGDALWNSQDMVDFLSLVKKVK